MAAIDTNLALSPEILLPRAAALLRGVPMRLSAPADPDDARARRDFVREITARNPDAFSSDLNVQAMMIHYPGHVR
jgi:hypothetical protein